MRNYIGQYVCVRSADAGVFCGVLAEQEGNVVVLHNSRRMWYWEGAASLSQLAVEGVKKPTDCKFPLVVPEEMVFGVIELIPVTDAARAIIEGTPVWSA